MNITDNHLKIWQRLAETDERPLCLFEPSGSRPLVFTGRASSGDLT